MLKMDFPTLQALGKNDVQEISILFQMLLWIMMAVWIMSIPDSDTHTAEKRNQVASSGDECTCGHSQLFLDGIRFLDR